MSASFEVQSSSGPYQVEIRCGVLQSFFAKATGAAIIADRFFEPLFRDLNVPAIFLQATEANKSLDQTPAVIERLRKAGANRQTELIAVGGGIVQDISAFIASVYMRGLAWTYFPTTVLAMVDSCIGGKSSINVGPYKNLVGTFHPPQRVLVDPVLAQTLPADEKASGLIEAAKICFCRGEEAFDRHLSYNPSISMSTEALEAVVENSLRSKKWFIETDEFDKNERLRLNFGHTFGHAIEGATHFAVPHGTAVGLGILCALDFERRRGIDYTSAPRVARLERHLSDMVRVLPEISAHLRAMPLADVLERFASDKKHGSDSFTVVVVDQGGEVVLRRVPKTREAAAAVGHSVTSVAERFW